MKVNKQMVENNNYIIKINMNKEIAQNLDNMLTVYGKIFPDNEDIILEANKAEFYLGIYFIDPTKNKVGRFLIKAHGSGLTFTIGEGYMPVQRIKRQVLQQGIRSMNKTDGYILEFYPDRLVIQTVGEKNRRIQTPYHTIGSEENLSDFKTISHIYETSQAWKKDAEYQCINWVVPVDDYQDYISSLQIPKGLGNSHDDSQMEISFREEQGALTHALEYYKYTSVIDIDRETYEVASQNGEHIAVVPIAFRIFYKILISLTGLRKFLDQLVFSLISKRSDNSHLPLLVSGYKQMTIMGNDSPEYELIVDLVFAPVPAPDPDDDFDEDFDDGADDDTDAQTVASKSPGSPDDIEAAAEELDAVDEEDLEEESE